MRTTRVRISKRDRAHAEGLAAATNRSMSGVVEEAIDAYRRNLFWDQYEQRIDRLRQDPATWADYTREHEEEAGALGDGLRSV